MIKFRLLEHWPLAAFTLALQLGCGMAIATAIALAQSPEISPTLRSLGLAMFPIVAGGLILSLLHLGRPLSAWRAMGNALQSRLSLEVLLSLAFAASAFACSFTWWTGVSRFFLHASVSASVFGVAAVASSAAVYTATARPIWNSAWVITSFLGSTVLVTGLALSLVRRPSSWGTGAVLAGSALLLLSAVWMWAKQSRPLESANIFRLWFAGYLLLIGAAPLLLILLVAMLSPLNSMALVCGLIVLGIFAGRMLMLALAEQEPRF